MTTTVDALPLGVTTSPAGRHVSDAVLEVGDLVDLYRRRDETRDPVGQQDLTLVERAVRTGVAQHLLVQRVPRLVAELLDATADDVSADTATDIEQATNADLRVFEAVERCKAVLDAVGLEALARLQADIESSERARFAELGGAVPPGWLDDAELTAMEVTTATGLGSHDIHARLSLATARTATAAELRRRLQAGSVTLHRASTIFAETRTLPDDAGLEIVDAALREKDGAPPSPSLFRQRLSRACLAADREAAQRRREARRRRRGAYAEIDPDGLGALHVTNDADKIIASMERVDAIARAARQAGDSRNLDALRADVITDILMFGWPSTSEMPPTAPTRRPRPVAPTPVGPRQEPVRGDRRRRRPIRSASRPRRLVQPSRRAPCCQRPHHRPVQHRRRGHGCAVRSARLRLGGGRPRPRDHAQLRFDLAPARRRRRHRSGHQPRDQGLSAHGSDARSRRGRRRHVPAPGCTVPASRCDLDHDIPWPHGPTDVSNLTSKHRAHHNAHTHGHWRVGRDGTDSVRWRTKAGRTYETKPKDWLEGLRRSRAPERRSRTLTDDDPPPF